MNLNEMTVEQLKALGFDLIGQLEVTQQNLRMVQELIVKKSQEGIDGCPSQAE